MKTKDFEVVKEAKRAAEYQLRFYREMMKKKEILGFFGEHRWLSNFAPATIEFVGLYFPTVEHAYVASKTTDFKKQEEISKVVSPGKVKRLGRELVLRSDWDMVKMKFMYEFLKQKFNYETYANLLLSTENAYLEETNTWGDTFWGVCNGVGQNNLGKLLMQIRDELRTTDPGRTYSA